MLPHAKVPPPSSSPPLPTREYGYQHRASWSSEERDEHAEQAALKRGSSDTSSWEAMSKRNRTGATIDNANSGRDIRDYLQGKTELVFQMTTVVRNAFLKHYGHSSMGSFPTNSHNNAFPAAEEKVNNSYQQQSDIFATAGYHQTLSGNLQQRASPIIGQPSLISQQLYQQPANTQPAPHSPAMLELLTSHQHQAAVIPTILANASLLARDNPGRSTMSPGRPQQIHGSSDLDQLLQFARGLSNAALSQSTGSLLGGSNMLDSSNIARERIYPNSLMFSSVLPDMGILRNSTAALRDQILLREAVTRERNLLLRQQPQYAMSHHTQFSRTRQSNSALMEPLEKVQASTARQDQAPLGLDLSRTSLSANIPLFLPVVMAIPEDEGKLSSHQVFLRHQIEAFKAGEDDVSTHTRGRNKPVKFGQVGIRCRHCAHLPIVHRQKGSTYFPASLLGLYQAAQNMSTTHMQTGLCTGMPKEVKERFQEFATSKVASSGGGRPYWAEAARRIGLCDTESDGIHFIRDVPPGRRR